MNKILIQLFFYDAKFKWSQSFVDTKIAYNLRRDWKVLHTCSTLVWRLNTIFSVSSSFTFFLVLKHKVQNLFKEIKIGKNL